MAYFKLLYFMLSILVINFILVATKHHLKKSPRKEKSGDKRHFIKNYGYKLYTQRSSVKPKDKDGREAMSHHREHEEGPSSQALVKNLDSSVIFNDDDENTEHNGNPDILMNNPVDSSALTAGTTTNANQEVVEDANGNHVTNQADDSIVNNNLITSADLVNENQAAAVHGMVGNHAAAAAVAAAHNDLVTDNTQVLTQASMHDMSPNLMQDGATATQTTHELVADGTQGATHDIDINEGAIIGHEPITGDDSHLQATTTSNHFIGNGKHMALQNNVMTGNVATNGINAIFPPLGDTNHLANNVTDVDVEDDDGNNNGATAAVAVDHVPEQQQHQQPLKHKELSHDNARVDEDKVISITHPLLKPNEYNENLKEMLAKTTADLGAI